METSDTFSFAVETLMNICGGVLSRDVISTILESCGGDLNLSVDAVMKITNESDNLLPENVPCNSDQVNEQKPVQNNDTSVLQNQPTNENQTPSVSYAAAFQRTGVIPKQQIKPKSIINPQTDSRNWTDQFRRIVSYNNLGYRILILMRGLPGSGKSFLAQRIVETTIGGKFVDFKTHICSTDDYFMFRGQYHFNKMQLHDAHVWNQNRCKLAMQQGLSPLIIDNTNIEIWEMLDYVKWGVPNGYIIEVVEPNTPWAKKPNQLVRRNMHNVPITSIKRMLDNYVNNVTGDSLLRDSGLKYPADRVPPVFRSMPVFHPDPQIPNPYSTSNSAFSLQSAESLNANAVSRLSISEPQIIKSTLAQEERFIAPTTNTDEALDEVLVTPSTTNAEKISTNVNDTCASRNPVEEIVTKNDESQETDNVQLNIEVQKQLEIEKIEQEWESGENWVEEQHGDEPFSNTSTDPKNIASTAPKPQRKKNSAFNSDEKLLETVNSTQDWRQISMFMHPWQNEKSSQISEAVDLPTETMSSSTCMEIGDAENSYNMFKVINATPRDINQFHMSFLREKIPEKRMLDKSSMTNDNLFTVPSKRCKSEENHFRELKKLFNNVSKTALREIFDKCMGDVNWAVEIVLDGVASNQLEIKGEEAITDDEEETNSIEDHQCNCLAAYNIMPDKSQPKLGDEQASENNKQTASGSIPKAQNQKKTKKDTNMSEDSLSIKRMIEQNVRVSDSHYSEHCLKIMRFRRGETELSEEVTEANVTEANVNEENASAACTSSKQSYQDTASSLPDDQDSDDEESLTGMEDVEKTVVVNLGKKFVTELDGLFGRRDMTYPDKVIPKINMPLSLLNEINALWMESLMHQLDEHDKQSAIMVQEDEEFARQLSMKEEELALAGIEPEIPNFKEIMDMDFAISIYQKDVAVWRTKEPNDLAAKMTREKLYNLFPDVPKEVLSELLMAHENNFQITVEVLLMSTGKADILEQKNGLNKFVMQKEMERQQRILEEERKALIEVEWPLLPKGEVVEMSVVDKYRDLAELHLHNRNVNHQKANEFVRRGVLQAAEYYGKIAGYHKLKYEQSNSMAAASLMQVHAANCRNTATIDLHYLRVGEAKESLDLFLDTHIQRLKETSGRGPRFHNLFFITGRGLHSNGGPKIKPAVKKRLQERGLSCSERNPGLLTCRVTANDNLTYQIP